MTASGIETGRWLPVPGYSSYEACDRGEVRSIDRFLADGRRKKGVTLRTRPSNRGYQLLDMVNDAGEKKTVTLHSIVLLTFAGPCPEGMEALHENDDQTDNRWPENLRWGTHPENVADRMRNRPATPKPDKRCVRCGDPFAGNGKRCHDCVVAIGREAAQMLAAGEDPDRVALALGYPSTVGVWRLAVKYGGARVVIAGAVRTPQIIPVKPRGVAAKPPLLHRVTTTLRARFGRGDTP